MVVPVLIDVYVKASKLLEGVVLLCHLSIVEPMLRDFLTSVGSIVNACTITKF